MLSFDGLLLLYWLGTFNSCEILLALTPITTFLRWHVTQVRSRPGLSERGRYRLTLSGHKHLFLTLLRLSFDEIITSNHSLRLFKQHNTVFRWQETGSLKDEFKKQDHGALMPSVDSRRLFPLTWKIILVEAHTCQCEWSSWNGRCRC